MLRKDIEQSPGVVTTVALQDGNLITGTTQDCAPIAERAKELHRSGYIGPSKDMRLAASVPYVLVEEYLNKNGITMREFTQSDEHKSRFLNNPEISHFRVWGGRI